MATVEVDVTCTDVDVAPGATVVTAAGSVGVASVGSVGVSPSSGSATDVLQAEKQLTDTTIAAVRRKVLIRS